MNTAIRAARVLTGGVAVAGLSASLLATAPAAQAGGTGSRTKTSPTATARTSQMAKVMMLARSKQGAPYRWGATGPWSFDCSGYTRWIYASIGKRLPRTANQQYAATVHISRSAARPGDLVFFGGARKYHVGIYAGANRMWHAPHSGSSVRLAKIWTSSVKFGRVR